MKNAGVSISDEVISKAVKYLKENIEKADNTTKAEIYWTLASL
jgi:hypothetical protein